MGGYGITGTLLCGTHAVTLIIMPASPILCEFSCQKFALLLTLNQVIPAKPEPGEAPVCSSLWDLVNHFYRRIHLAVIHIADHIGVGSN